MFVNPFPSPFAKSPFDNIQKTKKIVQRHPTNRYLNYAADRQGCGQWRLGWPELQINMTNKGDSTTLTKMVFEKSFYHGLKAVRLQRQASDQQKKFFEFLKSIQPEFGFKIIYEIDDVVFREEIPDYNVYKHAFDNDQIRQNCIDMINMSDEVTLTCKFMRDLFRQKTNKEEITVVPNFPPYWWLGHQYNYNKNIKNFDDNKKKPRIVYSGSGAHFDVQNKTGQQDDFTHVIKFIVDNVDKYQFIFIGAVPPPLKKLAEQRKIEVHPWKSLIEYPNFLNSLNAQLFLAPLQDNNFNKSKSDIKFVEAACLGVPCMSQDLVTYPDAPDFLRFKTSEDLEQKVETLLNWKNRKSYYKLIPELRKYGETRFLELDENIGCIMEALDTPYGSLDRKYLKKWN